MLLFIEADHGFNLLEWYGTTEKKTSTVSTTYLAPRKLGAILPTARAALGVTADVASLYAGQTIAAKAFKRTCRFVKYVRDRDPSGGAGARNQEWKASSRAV